MPSRSFTALLAAGGCCAAALLLRPAPTRGEQVPVFIFAGQSNMVGYATDSNELTLAQQRPEPHVLWADRQENPVSWQTMQAPTELSGQIFSGHGFGPELSAPLTISNAKGGQTVGAVKLAINGSGFGADIAPDWRADGNGEWYNQTIARVNSAVTQMPIQQPGRTAQVTAMFWMQGETDALDEDRAGQYQYNLTKLITQARINLASPNMPFIMGLTGLDAGDNADVIRRAQQNIAKILPNVTVVNLDDLPRATGIPFASLHYSSQSTYAMGVRFGQAYLDMTSVVKPTKPASYNKAVNGSFEDYALKKYLPVPGTFIGKDFTGDMMPGWTAIGLGGTLTRADAFGPGTAPAADGSQWMSLENRAFGTPPGDGGVQQTFATKFSTAYTIFFKYAVLADGSQQTTTFTADVNNANTQTLSVNSTGFGDLQMTPWANSSFSFTSGAAQSSATLHFVPRTTFNNGFYGPAIDDVRIIEGSIWKTNSGNWSSSDSTPWTGTPPTVQDTNANFLWLNTAPSTVTVSGTVQTSFVRIDSPQPYTFTGATIILNRFGSNNADRVSIQVGSGTHTINSTVELRRGVDVDIASDSQLTIAGQINRNNDTGWDLTKFGNGVLVLSNANNQYNGVTRIVEGTLKLVGGDSNNIQTSPSITVFKGATFDVSGENGNTGISLSNTQLLAGNGSVLGAVTATSTGNIIAPGHGAPGKLTFSGPGNITLNANATVQVEIGASSADADAAGYNYDQIVVDGSGKSFVTGGAKLQLIFSPSLLLGRTYTIITTANGAAVNFTGLFKNLLNQTLQEGNTYFENGRSYTIDYDAGFVSILIVPEPGSAIVLGAMCLLMRRRTRKSR